MHLNDFKWDETPPLPDRRLQTRFLSLFSSAISTDLARTTEIYAMHQATKQRAALTLNELVEYVEVSMRRNWVDNVVLMQVGHKRGYQRSRKCA